MSESKAEASAYVEVSVTVDRTLADPLCDFIIEHYSAGLVLEDEEDSHLTTMKFYLPEHDASDYRTGLAGYIKQLQPEASKPPVIDSRRVTNVDWEEQYRVAVEPIRIEPGIVIRAPWHEPTEAAQYEILLEPKMAFGTGRHETTRSCLQVIAQRFQAGWRLLDLGCGSGILSVLADKKGAGFIKAIDYDIIAVDNCRQNFQLNDVVSPHEILFGSIEKCDRDRPYDFVCVNIIRRTILEMLPRLKSLTVDGGLLLLAGLLQPDEAEVSTALDSLGLGRYSTVQDNDWFTFLVEKD
jgi:ribosomal protein L11 methyltransferase